MLSAHNSVIMKHPISTKKLIDFSASAGLMAVVFAKANPPFDICKRFITTIAPPFSRNGQMDGGWVASRSDVMANT